MTFINFCKVDRVKFTEITENQFLKVPPPRTTSIGVYNIRHIMNKARRSISQWEDAPKSGSEESSSSPIKSIQILFPLLFNFYVSELPIPSKLMQMIQITLSQAIPHLPQHLPLFTLLDVLSKGKRISTVKTPKILGVMLPLPLTHISGC